MTLSDPSGLEETKTFGTDHPLVIAATERLQFDNKQVETLNLQIAEMEKDANAWGSGSFDMDKYAGLKAALDLWQTDQKQAAFELQGLLDQVGTPIESGVKGEILSEKAATERWGPTNPILKDDALWMNAFDPSHIGILSAGFIGLGADPKLVALADGLIGLTAGAGEYLGSKKGSAGAAPSTPLQEALVPRVESSIVDWTGYAQARVVESAPASLQPGLQELSIMRQELGLAEGEGTLARLDVGGKTYYGINAHGQTYALPEGVWWRSKGHAEHDVFGQAAREEVRDFGGTLYVDRPVCYFCTNSLAGFPRGNGGWLDSLGLSELRVVEPGTTYTGRR